MPPQVDQNNSIPEQPIIIASQRVKNLKSKIIILIIFIIFVAGIKYQILTQPTVQSDTVLQADQTQSWKTYRSDTYGFEFKYPKEWHQIQPSKPSGISAQVSNMSTIRELSEDSIKNDSFFIVTVRENANLEGYPIENWADGLTVVHKPQSEVLLSIDEKPAIKIEVVEANGVNFHIYISKGRDIVELIYSASQPQYTEMYNEILSTFKFTK